MAAARMPRALLCACLAAQAARALQQRPACGYQVHVVAPLGKESLRNGTTICVPGQEIDNSEHRRAYQVFAGAAERVWEAAGLKAAPHEIQAFQYGAISRETRHSAEVPQKCRLDKHFKSMIDAWSLDTKWDTGHEQDVRDAVAYATQGFVQHADATEVCNRLALTSLAWEMMNGYQGSDPTLPSVTDIVREQHRWFEAYYGHGRRATNRLQLSPCYVFPKPQSALCKGGLAQYPHLVSDLEPLLPGGRNLWYHEVGKLIDFTAYRPLPSIAGFDHSRILLSQKILLVAGANGFYRGTKYLIDMYSPYFEFDRVIMIEPDTQGMEIPKEYNFWRNVEFWKGFAKVASCDQNDLVKRIREAFQPEDYVVVMFDVDEGNKGPTMEWGWLAQLVSEETRVVDELFIELHMYKPEIGWLHDRHSAREQFDVMHQLRHQCGAAVHAWP